MRYNSKPKTKGLEGAVNPFIVNEKILSKIIDLDSKVIIEVNDNINIPAGKITNKMLVENSTYTKVFHDVAFNKFLCRIDNLNAYKLLFFVIGRLKPGEDYIWLNFNLVREYTGFRGKSEFDEAVDILIRYGVLCMSPVENTYWINPLMFFSGNRLKKYPDNVSVK